VSDVLQGPVKKVGHVLVVQCIEYLFAIASPAHQPQVAKRPKLV